MDPFHFPFLVLTPFFAKQRTSNRKRKKGDIYKTFHFREAGGGRHLFQRH